MIRSPAHRLIALWAWIVLLLNGSGDAFGVHPCPHHDAVAHAPAAEVAEGGHGDAHHAPAAGDEDGHGGSCTCLGSCLTGTAAPLPEPVVFAAAPAVAAQPSPVFREAAVLPGRPPYVLPYATAPPVRLA